MKYLKSKLALGAGVSALVLSGFFAQASTPSKDAVLDNYANIAHAKYSDSLTTAQSLKAALDALVANPNEKTLGQAKAAWLAARVPYQQTEAYRFGNAIVDDWEGRVNAWPLDEGLIDYVDAGSYGTESDENSLYVGNVIANERIVLNGKAVDASTIDLKLLAETLHEAEDVEANVATGYHAIEFLLWGQDLNGTGAGAGNRPATDFDVNNCTGGNCDRRIAYLKAAANLLIADIEEMVANWEKDGAARSALEEAGVEGGVTAIFTGLGSLSYGELAGERIKLGLMLHDPEEEHDCFSDNTHNSHYYDVMGIRNVYLGKYTRLDGTVIEGPSVSDLVRGVDETADTEVRSALDATMEKMSAMKARAEGGEAYDQMIGEGNPEGNAVVQASVDALVSQTKSLERAIAALELTPIAFEGSDSLDDPNAVFQ